MEQNVQIHKDFKVACEKIQQKLQNEAETLKHNNAVVGEKAEVEKRLKNVEVMKIFLNAQKFAFS